MRFRSVAAGLGSLALIAGVNGSVLAVTTPAPPIYTVSATGTWNFSEPVGSNWPWQQWWPSFPILQTDQLGHNFTPTGSLTITAGNSQLARGMWTIAASEGGTFEEGVGSQLGNDPVCHATQNIVFTMPASGVWSMPLSQLWGTMWVGWTKTPDYYGPMTYACHYTIEPPTLYTTSGALAAAQYSSAQIRLGVVQPQATVQPSPTPAPKPSPNPSPTALPVLTIRGLPKDTTGSKTLPFTVVLKSASGQPLVGQSVYIAMIDGSGQLGHQTGVTNTNGTVTDTLSVGAKPQAVRITAVGAKVRGSGRVLVNLSPSRSTHHPHRMKSTPVSVTKLTSVPHHRTSAHAEHKARPKPFPWWLLLLLLAASSVWYWMWQRQPQPGGRE